MFESEFNTFSHSSEWLGVLFFHEKLDGLSLKFLQQCYLRFDSCGMECLVGRQIYALPPDTA
jgi:hypothetical protein